MGRVSRRRKDVGLRWSAGRCELGQISGQIEVGQDLCGDLGCGDGGDDLALASAVIAGKDVVEKYPRKQRCPAFAVNGALLDRGPVRFGVV
jgi:hypothetical protein